MTLVGAENFLERACFKYRGCRFSFEDSGTLNRNFFTDYRFDLASAGTFLDFVTVSFDWEPFLSTGNRRYSS